MTTFWLFLAHLTPADWLLLFVAWLIVAFALGTFTGLGIKLADRREQSWTDLELAQPPVPETDAAWVSVWPSAVDDDALCDAEFVSLIAATWQWPDTEDAA